jgi:hypothetical protein
VVAGPVVAGVVVVGAVVVVEPEDVGAAKVPVDVIGDGAD